MDIQVGLDDVDPVENLPQIREMLHALPGNILYAQVQAKEIILLSDPHWRSIEVTISPPEGERFSRHDALRILQCIPGYFGRWQWLDKELYKLMEKGVIIFKLDGSMTSKEGMLKDLI